jgi:uncharacterized protein (DUF1810 family)
VKDRHDLGRFVRAQAPVFARVLEELRAGHKTTHWMWFIFPQIAGLGHSPTARAFAISDLSEAKAYLAHDLLGPRLTTCTKLANDIPGRSAYEIFGTPDDLKFRSSMTLFAKATSDPAILEQGVFNQALATYFRGEPDDRTLAILSQQARVESPKP